MVLEFAAALAPQMAEAAGGGSSGGIGALIQSLLGKQQGSQTQDPAKAKQEALMKLLGGLTPSPIAQSGFSIPGMGGTV